MSGVGDLTWLIHSMREDNNGTNDLAIEEYRSEFEIWTLGVPMSKVSAVGRWC